jgi:hypothetical protein
MIVAMRKDAPRTAQAQARAGEQATIAAAASAVISPAPTPAAVAEVNQFLICVAAVKKAPAVIPRPDHHWLTA